MHDDLWIVDLLSNCKCDLFFIKFILELNNDNFIYYDDES